MGVCACVQTDSDMEWKFARTKLWMTYIDEKSTLPVPLNMIPTPKSFRYAVTFIIDLICRHDDDVTDDKPETVVYDLNVSHTIGLKHFYALFSHRYYYFGNKTFLSRRTSQVGNVKLKNLQIHAMQRSVTRPALLTLIVSLVLSRLDYGNATLAGSTSYMFDKLQSVFSAAARLIFSKRRLRA